MALDAPNKFARPIPGQGLTTEFGSMPWQKPPRFVHLDQALEFVWERLTQPQSVGQALALLSTKKITCQDIADTMLFQGFTQGLWTMTLGLLMYRPTFQMVVAVAHKAGIKYKATTDKADPLVKLMQTIKMEEDQGVDLVGQQDQQQPEQPPSEQPMRDEMPSEQPPTPPSPTGQAQSVPGTGLMGMPGGAQ